VTSLLKPFRGSVKFVPSHLVPAFSWLGRYERPWLRADNRCSSMFRRSAPALAVLVLSAVGLTAQDGASDLEREVNPRSGLACPAAASYSLTRPDPEGTPTPVAVGIFFQDIAQLNDVDQTMDADVYVVVRWRDERLVDASRGTGAAECRVPDGALWMPALEPENLRARQVFYAPRFLVDARGVVTYGRRLWVKLACPLDFRDFPFDRHRWNVTLWPVLEKADAVVFQPLRRAVGMNDRLTLQGWRVQAPTAAAATEARPPRSGTFSRLDVTVNLERRWGYYAWKLGFPLVLIVLMAYGVYYIPGSAVAQQVGLGMTSMLTLIAYMLSLGGALPKISYLTRADRFFMGSALLVFLGLGKAVLTIALGQGGEHPMVAKVNHWGRRLYPLVMLANVMLALFW